MNSASRSDPGLIIESVSHAYGRTTVVRKASLTAKPGDIHCLLGPSGSGKTTLLRLVAGLERLQAGCIAIFGQQVAAPAKHVPPEKRSIGFVFQDYALFPHLSVRGNVMFGISKRPRARRLERARALLADVGMSDFEKAMPHTLSGGQQQRVALARALARDPAVMLLDEPFSGLDARLRDEVRGATMDVLRSANVATLMVTHHPQEAMMVADTISVIHEGRIEQTGTPDELYSRPGSQRVALSLGEANVFAGKVAAGRIETPLGSVPSAAFGDGTKVTLLLRPEAVAVSAEPSQSSAVASVVSARTVGGNQRIVVQTQCGQRIVALVASSNNLSENQTVHLSLDERRVIVLPAQTPGTGLSACETDRNERE